MSDRSVVLGFNSPCRQRKNWLLDGHCPSRNEAMVNQRVYRALLPYHSEPALNCGSDIPERIYEHIYHRYCREDLYARVDQGSTFDNTSINYLYLMSHFNS